MPDATPAAPAAKTATETPKTTAPADVTTPPPGQPGPQETKPAETKPPTPEQKDMERRAAALAAAKRESAKLHQEREAFSREKLEHAEQVKQAAEFKRLTDLKAADPMKFLEEIGLSVPDLSKQFIAKTTGAGKTPAELVKEEVARQRAEDEKVRVEQTKKNETAEQERQKAAALAGAKKQMEEIVKADAEKFELCLDLGAPAIDRAWALVEKFHQETFDAATGRGQVLDFGKALAAIEAEEEERLTRRLSSGKKGTAAMEKARAAAAAKKKDDEAKAAATKAAAKAEEAKKLSAKSRSSVDSRPVETETNPSPVHTPKRGLSPRQIGSMAQQLWDERAAKQDN